MLLSVKTWFQLPDHFRELQRSPGSVRSGQQRQYQHTFIILEMFDDTHLTPVIKCPVKYMGSTWFEELNKKKTEMKYLQFIYIEILCYKCFFGG